MIPAVTVVPNGGPLTSGFNPKASEYIHHRFPPFENRERWGSQLPTTWMQRTGPKKKPTGRFGPLWPFLHRPFPSQLGTAADTPSLDSLGTAKSRVIRGIYMTINPDQFAKIAESLRQYRRAELSDFEAEVGGNPIDTLYVDPLESDAVLKTVTLNHTTFLVGRKGTGKSTVFAKAQIELRKRTDAISIYVDVKSLHELLSTNEAVVQTVHDGSISEPVFRAHSLRKNFLAAVVSDLIKELKGAYETRSLIERWVGKARGYQAVIGELEQLAAEVKSAKLTQEELPILRMISAKTKESAGTKESLTTSARIEAKVAPKPEVKASVGFETSTKALPITKSTRNTPTPS